MSRTEKRLYAVVEFPVESESEFELIRDAAKLPKERWKLVEK